MTARVLVCNTEVTKPANLDKIDSLRSVGSEQRTPVWSSFRWLRYPFWYGTVHRCRSATRRNVDDCV